MWCIPELDDAYIARMEDVLAIYERPLDASEPVVCLDEKPVSLHGEVRPVQTAAPGRIARRDSEYKRFGTSNVFCAVEPKAGRHFTFATADRSGPEFAKVLDRIVRRYPDAETIHLVMDNLNIHSRRTLTNYFGMAYGGKVWDRLIVHYTPKHGSWLNQAEIEIGLFNRQCLGNRRISSLDSLRRESQAWNRRMNRKRVTIQWAFTRRKARAKFGYQPNRIRRSEN
jgi:DDE superfamily endonuclease